MIFITSFKDTLILNLYDYESGESKTLYPNPVEDGKKPTEVARVNYWDFANAVYHDAAGVVAKQGFSGVYQGRNPLTDKYSHFGQTLLPPIPFVWLAQLTRLLGEQQKPVWNLADEREFICNLEKFKRPQSEDLNP